jgi:hypothetical protein
VSLLHDALIGAAAGTVGTMTPYGITYGDVRVRGQPASSVPSRVAGQMVKRPGTAPSAQDEEKGGPTAPNRQSGVSTLQRFTVELGIGIAYKIRSIFLV